MLMPRGWRSLGSPIPECKRMCGVPILPAEIITSLEAVSVKTSPDAKKREIKLGSFKV